MRATLRLATLAMPKKSLQEKIAADERRSLYQFRMPAVRETRVSVVTDELTAIKKDLRKTLFLASIAIIAEFALYWFGRR